MFFGDNQWNQLYGGPGNDYYQVDYSWDFSNHRIYDYDTTPGNIDTLQIRGPVTADQVRLYGVQGGSLSIELDTEQRIVIVNYLLDKAFVVERIRFDDGSELNEATIRQRLGLPAPTQASLLTPAPAWAGEPPAAALDGAGLLLAAAALWGG
ncbi:hypothetical protein L1F06_022860 [Ectopseudomonas hydrolytica]|uniref:Haemolysin-type calcium binding-related domain-containing protein n=3 Tax=Pseudomonadaceae TaxID=135621 RepID=A0ABY5AH63_9GAMM|nr:hypothetical protein L1F06_022860 [Pseudomonas hydrolytica]